MAHRRAALASLTLAAAILAAAYGPGDTLAVFRDAEAPTAGLDTDVLDPPTGLGATSGTSVALAWTPTTDTYAAAYEILRSATAGGGHVVVGTATPRSASGATDTPANGTWYYVVRSRFGQWHSAPSNEASATVSSSMTTPLAGCTTNAADTGGDGNGFQTTPARACDADGQLAVDVSTGTNSVDSCANAGKDRHGFGGYATGLPAAVTAITGITVRLDAGMNNNGGTTRVCAQLSWDGGTSWTALKTATLTDSAMTTYTLGGATDMWGHAWTAAELASATFVVRLVNSSTQPNKDIRLDLVGVRVTYTP